MTQDILELKKKKEVLHEKEKNILSEISRIKAQLKRSHIATKHDRDWLANAERALRQKQSDHQDILYLKSQLNQEIKQMNVKNSQDREGFWIFFRQVVKENVTGAEYKRFINEALALFNKSQSNSQVGLLWQQEAEKKK